MQFEEGATNAALSILQTSRTSEIQESWEGDVLIQQLIAKLSAGSVDAGDYTYHNGMLKYKVKLYIGANGDL